jgi:hypothetical protein
MSAFAKSRHDHPKNVLPNPLAVRPRIGDYGAVGIAVGSKRRALKKGR